ncbi:MAG: YHS domain-containing protein [Candidatus Omnitrophica bacterium]|nr:YHS domain-containing protein [Candidatus Omnitrophota bacterium]
MKRFYVVMVLGILLLASHQSAQAQNATSDTNGTDKVTQSQDVGNKICPISGAKIVSNSGMASAIYEYEGKIYHFCCAGCISAFKKDPQKYILKVEEELKAEQASQEKDK